jgi:hypothetical protein
MAKAQTLAFEELCRFLADRVMRWNWTGPTGRLIGDVNDTYIDDHGGEHFCHRIKGAQDIEALEAAEIFYLLNVQQAETPQESKDFLADSETTSSATSPKATTEPPATSGRSRTKAR